MEQAKQLSEGIASGDILKSLETYVELKKKGYSVQIKENNQPNEPNIEQANKEKENK